MNRAIGSPKPTDADIRAAIDIWDNHLFWENLGRGRISILENIDPQEPINVASTAFMRYGHFFRHFAPYAAAQHPQGFRLQSACCSAGAEAYSLAMIFKDAGLKMPEITAFDRSVRLSKVARAAVYPTVMGLGLAKGQRRHMAEARQDRRFLRVAEDARKAVHVMSATDARDADHKSIHHVTMLFNTLIHLNNTQQLEVVHALARTTEHMLCFNVYDRRDAKALTPVLDVLGFAPVDADFKPVTWDNAGTFTEKGFDGQADTVVACIRMKRARSYTI